MKLSNPFRFWPERLYSLPTLRGLIPLAITLYAGFISFTKASPAHQWLVVMMSLFTVIHLIESSRTLRLLVLAPDPNSTIFAGIPSKIQLLCRRGELRAPLHLMASYPNPGVFSFPGKRVELVSQSGLFRYWRNFQFKERAFVLPTPVDHGVPFQDSKTSAPSDPDKLVPIRDPRLLSFRDEKIFQKTGKSVLRTSGTGSGISDIRLEWSSLQHLNRGQALEQISFWIKQLEEIPPRGVIGIHIQLPFFSGNFMDSTFDFRPLKEALAGFAGASHLERELES
jgi:hypothetical protein